MKGLLYLLLLAAIVVLAGIVCVRNYKNRGKALSNNLVEYCAYILEKYNLLSDNQRSDLRRDLTDKENDILMNLVNNPNNVGKNLYILQNQMMTLESIMKKIKTISA